MLYVFLKAAQQWNVLRFRYKLIWPFSFGMAACEVFIVSQIAIHLDPWFVIPLGGGAAIGAIIAMRMQVSVLGETHD